MDLRLAIESLLFAAQKPLTPAEIRDFCRAAAEHWKPASSENTEPTQETREPRTFAKPSAKRIHQELEQLAEEHEQFSRSYRLICVAGAWQFVTRSQYAPWVRALVGQKPRPPKLSQPALETLAIIAYRQPLTRAEAEQIRGVSVDGVIQTLLERELIEQRGRAEAPGRPITYGTTGYFLEYFGLKSLDNLPDAPELRRIPTALPGSENTGNTAAETSPQTVQPGLATTPDPAIAAPPADRENTQQNPEPEAGIPAAPPTTATPNHAPANQPPNQRSQAAKAPQSH